MGIGALRRYERQGVTKLEDVTPKEEKPKKASPKKKATKEK
ncbi:MAG: hypothetical protein ACI4OP_04205 [Candidatus Coprovivens sp.]|jgi:hypothetical protein